jgi:hypothetical protein
LSAVVAVSSEKNTPSSSTIVCGSKLECVFLTLTLTLNFQKQVQEITTNPEKWEEAMFNAKELIEKLREERDAIRSKTKGTYVCMYVCMLCM